MTPDHRRLQVLLEKPHLASNPDALALAIALPPEDDNEPRGRYHRHHMDPGKIRVRTTRRPRS